MKILFLQVIDNVGETYYLNLNSIAYLKKSDTPKPIYKIVLNNEKQILVSNKIDFQRICSAIGH